MLILALAVFVGAAVIALPLYRSAELQARSIRYSMERDLAYDRLHSAFIADLARKVGLETPAAPPAPATPATPAAPTAPTTSSMKSHD